jgi:hypothetical protein
MQVTLLLLLEGDCDVFFSILYGTLTVFLGYDLGSPAS